MDLSKLSDADVQALAAGDMSKLSDEGLTHISSQADAAPALPEEEGLKGGSVRGIIDLLRPGFTQGVGHGGTDALTLGNVNIKDKSDDDLGHAVGEIAGTGAVAAAGGSLASAPASALGRIGAQTAVSGVQGALQKPEGEDTLAARAKNGGFGAMLGGILQAGGEGLSKLIGKGAKTAQDFRDLKSGDMADRAVSAIDDASQAIGDKQIAPRDAQLRELLQGKQFEINPDRVKPTFPNLGNKMASKLPTEDVPKVFSNDAGKFTAPVEQATEARVPISGERALRLKRAADSVADYGASKPFDPAATASGEEAKSLADILRKQINADPKAAALNDEMGSMASLRDALVKREGTAPIETLKAPLDSSRHAVLAKVDKAAGSNLLGLGKDIEDAKSIELHPSNLFKPLNWLSETKAMGLRGGAEASRVLNKAPAGTKESLINALIQSREGGR